LAKLHPPTLEFGQTVKIPRKQGKNDKKKFGQTEVFLLQKHPFFFLNSCFWVFQENEKVEGVKKNFLNSLFLS
jgi:hypothetical protein